MTGKQTLTDLIHQWWDDVFTGETSTSDLVDRIEEWLPNFKSNEGWEAFLNRFDDRWQCKKALLDRVKDDMFPGYSWDQLQGPTLEIVNEMVQSILCDIEFERVIVDSDQRSLDQ